MVKKALKRAIIYYPADEMNFNTVNKAVSSYYREAVIGYIKKLKLNKSEAEELYNRIAENMAIKRGGTPGFEGMYGKTVTIDLQHFD